MSEITRADILKLAKLSKLELDESQVEKYRTEISEIVDYVDQLRAVDVSGLEPTNQVSGLVNVVRNDEIKSDYATPAELLKNLPSHENNSIKVKRMIG